MDYLKGAGQGVVFAAAGLALDSGLRDSVPDKSERMAIQALCNVVVTAATAAYLEHSEHAGSAFMSFTLFYVSQRNFFEDLAELFLDFSPKKKWEASSATSRTDSKSTKKQSGSENCPGSSSEE
jgi:hypothetical protein